MGEKMTRQAVSDKLADIIHSNIQEFKDTKFTDGMVINTDAAVDSMSFIYLMCKIEAEFNIEIPSKKWKKLQTFGDVVDIIYKAL